MASLRSPSLSGKDLDTNARLGMELMKRGKYEDAIIAFDKSITCDTFSKFMSAECYLKQYQTSGNKEALDYAMQVYLFIIQSDDMAEPIKAEARAGLNHCNMAEKDFDKQSIPEKKAVRKVANPAFVAEMKQLQAEKGQSVAIAQISRGFTYKKVPTRSVSERKETKAVAKRKKKKNIRTTVEIKQIQVLPQESFGKRRCKSFCGLVQRLGMFANYSTQFSSGVLIKSSTDNPCPPTNRERSTL